MRVINYWKKWGFTGLKLYLQKKYSLRIYSFQAARIKRALLFKA